MPRPGDCELLGQWRIVEADIWDRDYLDLCGPATMTIGTKGNGELRLGALEATLFLTYSRTIVFFKWRGADDLHETAGDGTAELLEDGTTEITLEYESGDEAILKAHRDLPI